MSNFWVLPYFSSLYNFRLLSNFWVLPNFSSPYNFRILSNFWVLRNFSNLYNFRILSNFSNFVDFSDFVEFTNFFKYSNFRIFEFCRIFEFLFLWPHSDQKNIMIKDQLLVRGRCWKSTYVDFWNKKKYLFFIVRPFFCCSIFFFDQGGKLGSRTPQCQSSIREKSAKRIELLTTSFVFLQIHFLLFEQNRKKLITQNPYLETIPKYTQILAWKYARNFRRFKIIRSPLFTHPNCYKKKEKKT